MSRVRGRRWVGLFVLAILVVPYIACDREHLVIDEAVRAKAGGSYARLADGTTHYELRGPEGAPPVVLVHGASGPMRVWDFTMDALSTSGRRVLRYDLLGRGFSDRPRTIYDLALFERQLSDLLDAAGVKGPVDIVGSSMGAIVASRFATVHPDRVRKIVLIGPAGFPIETTPVAKLIAVPIVGDWAMTVFGDRTLSAHNRRYYAAPSRFPEAGRLFGEQLEYKGYKAAILSTMRNMPMNDFAEGFRAVGALGKPVLLIWGKEDRTFPFSNLSAARNMLTGCETLTVDDAGHVPQYERADVVSPRIVEFLSQ